jgi:Tol biopolymer transport system component
MKRCAATVVLLALASTALLAGPAAATFKGHDGRIAWAVWNAGGGGGGGFASLTTYNTRGRAARQLGYCPEDDSGNVCSNWYDVTYSPDGSQLLWDQADSSGKRLIVLAGADGSHPTPIADEPTDDTQANFSPDGNRIVYVRQLTGSGGSDGTIVTGDVTGNNLRVLSASIRGSAPEFTPDGKRIVFLRATGGIWSIGRRGQSPRRLIARAAAFDIAPDGHSIAYLTSRGGLYIARSDGTRARRLAREPVSDLPSPAVSFSPDGKQIVFSAFGHSHDSGAAIYLIGASGGKPRLLKDSLDPRTVTSGLAWQPLP